MAAERIYFVRTKPVEGQPTVKRLVRASHPSTALMHVASSTYEVTVATQNDLEAMLGAGVKVEAIKPQQQELPG